MTKTLQELLTQYGILSITISEPKRQRQGSKYESLEAYYESLGGPLPDEPVLLVRISKDGGTHFLDENEHEVRFVDEQGNKTGIVTVWELPEDEFWYFRAFRPAMFDLEKEIPLFLYEMAVVQAYSMFEAYLTAIMESRLRRHPKLMAQKRQITYEQILDAPTKEALVDEMVEREIRDWMYLPLSGVLEGMREKFGFRSLPNEYDRKIMRVSLLRNCLLHNASKVSQELANYSEDLQEGARIIVGEGDVSDAVNVLRKFAYQIDQAFESLNA